MGVKFKGPLGKKNAVIIALVVILLILIGGTGAAIPFILSKKKELPDVDLIDIDETLEIALQEFSSMVGLTFQGVLEVAYAGNEASQVPLATFKQIIQKVYSNPTILGYPEGTVVPEDDIVIIEINQNIQEVPCSGNQETETTSNACSVTIFNNIIYKISNNPSASGNASDRLKTALGIDVERKVAIVKSQIVLTGNLYSYKKHDIQTLRRAVKAELLEDGLLSVADNITNIKFGCLKQGDSVSGAFEDDLPNYNIACEMPNVFCESPCNEVRDNTDNLLYYENKVLFAFDVMVSLDLNSNGRFSKVVKSRKYLLTSESDAKERIASSMLRITSEGSNFNKVVGDLTSGSVDSFTSSRSIEEAKTKAATIETHTTTFEEFVEEQREDVSFNTRRANTLGTVKSDKRVIAR